jgi:RimJ/RimL family protein N-acetyltransferase
VTEAAAALLDFGFGELDRDEIISFAVKKNTRSTAVMERLGMRRDRDFDHPDVPDTHPELKPFVLYRLNRKDWHAGRAVA